MRSILRSSGKSNACRRQKSGKKFGFDKSNFAFQMYVLSVLFNPNFHLLQLDVSEEKFEFQATSALVKSNTKAALPLNR